MGSFKVAGWSARPILATMNFKLNWQERPRALRQSRASTYGTGRLPVIVSWIAVPKTVPFQGWLGRSGYKISRTLSEWHYGGFFLYRTAVIVAYWAPVFVYCARHLAPRVVCSWDFRIHFFNDAYLWDMRIRKAAAQDFGTIWFEHVRPDDRLSITQGWLKPLWEPLAVPPKSEMVCEDAAFGRLFWRQHGLKWWGSALKLLGYDKASMSSWGRSNGTSEAAEW